MKRSALAGLVLVLSLSAAAQATPTVTLTFTTTGTLWKLWATVSSDCAGLASFDISFGGAGGGALGTVVTSTQKAYRVADPDTDYIGFNSTFKSNGTVSGEAVADIINGQATAYGDANDPAKDALVIQGCGQYAHPVYNVAGDTQLGTIACPFLLAQGIISGTLPLMAGTGIGNVLKIVPWEADFNGDGKVSFADYLMLEQNFGKTGRTKATGDANNDGKCSFADYQVLESQFGQSGLWHGPGNAVGANFVWGNTYTLEPTSLALLAFGSLAMLRRTRTGR